jgi:hypothetical protein
MNKVINALMISLLSTICIAIYPSVSYADGDIFFKDQNGKEPLDTRDAKLTKGGTISVYIDSCKVDDVEFVETKRQTRFASDMALLIGKLAGAAKAACTPNYVLYQSNELQFDRASVKISALKGNKEVSAITVITGPEEHAYLSLDLPVNNTKTLKYDTASKSLIPQNTNPQMYLGFNYLWGDIASPVDSKSYKDASIFDRISAKFMVSASSRPLDSYGIGIGLRLPQLSSSIDLTSFTIFAARIWSKEDAITNGLVQYNDSKKASTRFGISYDLGTGLKWVK